VDANARRCGVCSGSAAFGVGDGVAGASRVGSLSRHYGTDTRAQALLLGAALGAFIPDGRFRPARADRTVMSLAGGAGALFLFWCFFAARETSIVMYRGGHALVALATTAVIASAIHGGRTALNRVLRFEPLRVVGRISYGLYLWHWPVDLVLNPPRTRLHPVLLFGVRIVATFGLAIVSWAFVERPALAGRSLRSRRAGALSIRRLISRRRGPRSRVPLRVFHSLASVSSPARAGCLRAVALEVLGVGDEDAGRS
jgi:peptidoglycan/LPS O-acetylase OafA/YrhL